MESRFILFLNLKKFFFFKDLFHVTINFSYITFYTQDGDLSIFEGVLTLRRHSEVIN